MWMEGGAGQRRRAIVKERGGERLEGIEEGAIHVKEGEGVCV